MNTDSMDAVFVALANPVRRRMLDILKDNPGSSVNDVCAFFEMSRIGVMKHLQILEAAKLVVSRKSGRTRHLFHNAVPIRMIYDRWTTEYSAVWAKKMTQIKYKIEANMPTETERENRSVRRRGGRSLKPASDSTHSKIDLARQTDKQDNPSEKTE
jgi:DNA-binding transcriptional ArsR family regulator